MSPRSLHKIMVGATLTVALVASLGLLQPQLSAAWAQHGQHGGGHGQAAHEISDPDAMLAMLGEHLGLNEAQQQALAQPVAEGFAALQQLHAAHEAIVAELTAEQADAFNAMVHEMMSTGGMATVRHGIH